MILSQLVTEEHHTPKREVNDTSHNYISCYFQTHCLIYRKCPHAGTVRISRPVDIIFEDEPLTEEVYTQ